MINIKLQILASSSKGNCYILQNEKEALIIEAGIKVIEIKKALNFNTSKVVGCLFSHIHLDHSRYSKDISLMGIPIVSPWTVSNMKCGGFTVRHFDNVHNVECYGYYIKHDDFGSLVFYTDTEYVRYIFKNVNHIMAEANYSNKSLSNQENRVKIEHVLYGHCSIETTLDFIEINKSEHLKTITLLHLSETNGNPQEFKKEVENIVDENVIVNVAVKGLEIEL